MEQVHDSVQARRESDINRQCDDSGVKYVECDAKEIAVSVPVREFVDVAQLAALRKSPPSNNNSGAGDGGHRDCAPCANHSKVMGEQRSRRPGRQPSIDLIDNTRSRGTSAAPQARKIRPERHRKSDRRRDRRRRAKTQLETEKHCRNEINQSPERPVNPRVNPIFVWVRQEDTRIVEVKCEDYDKRNRILLTKTPQGWRAIPRTETLVPSLKEEADKKQHHHHHHRSKKSKKHKIKSKSTAIQVGDMSDENQEEIGEEAPQPEVQNEYPSWESPVNVESLLPSHTIHVLRKDSPGSEQSPPNSSSVNSGVNDSAQTQSKCSADRIYDVSPLDNLLAVAELEFNQQIQSGEWNTTSHPEQIENEETNNPNENLEEMNEDQKNFMEDMEHLQNLIESCTQDDEGKLNTGEGFMGTTSKEECDYTEDEENNLAMDDILSRLEQSLRSPESTEICLSLNDNDANAQTKPEEEKTDDLTISINTECNDQEFESTEESNVQNQVETEDNVPSDETMHLIQNQINQELIEETMNEDSKLEEPTDLSLKPKQDLTIEIPSKNDEPEQPTDLSIPKQIKLFPITTLATRPPSQNSEALQSPQPSGIPAVPPSPDIVSPGNVNFVNSSVSNKNNKTTFLETLLASTSPKINLNSEVTIERQKEPLDLGKCRKSASPTVTCSEEVQSGLLEGEPPPKKTKVSEPMTLKNLLDTINESKVEEKSQIQETPKLLELLNTETDLSPVVQLHHLLADKTFNIPDPMLVPKDKLSKIIANPALAYPHLLQDPDILVITLQQLETIVKKQNPMTGLKCSTTTSKETNEKHSEKHSSRKLDKEISRSKSTSNRAEEPAKTGHATRNFDRKVSDLAEMDMATNNAFNQMFWLPYMNQMEAMQFGGNPEFMKMLTNANMASSFPTQMSDLSHLLTNNRFPTIPTNFPMHSMNYNNSMEMQMWQEAMMQASMLGHQKSTPSIKDFMEKKNHSSMNKGYMQNSKFQMQSKQNMHNQYFPPPTSIASISNPYMNLPQAYQSNMKGNIPMPHQFNTSYSPKMTEHVNMAKHHSKMDSKMNNSFVNSSLEKSMSYGRNPEHGSIRTKPAYKLMNNVSAQQKNSAHEHHHHSREKNTDGPSRQLTSQPIDLSGASTTTTGKLKVKNQQQLLDPLSHRKLMRHDDIPEVGSTTASIEEMQEAHKHLWHPLFGNEKGYNNPWNWTPSATATAE
ncbi:hypothetical protein WA026_016881 [Henosepilachna vigintioctopunctata]|uniref:Uncharacterized protein n=1 Tax=Henosepilachna vigintioctopunctata TaxID=420089 RepID=A0AAW1U026_9CUCU